MQYPALDLLALPAVAIEEALHQPADLCANHFRNILCQQDVESGIAQIESHGAQRIGKRVSLCDENLRPARFFSADDNARRPIAKKNGQNPLPLPNLLPLNL